MSIPKTIELTFVGISANLAIINQQLIPIVAVFFARMPTL